MYPTRIAFAEVLDRISVLRANGHSAEGLVTSVFTLEKLMRRSMRVAIVSRGFTSDQANRLLERRGFDDLKKMWDIFDRGHESLVTIIGERDWQHIPPAVKARNEFVHGLRVYNLAECEAMAGHVVTGLQKLHAKVTERYGRDPWEKIKTRRKPQLQWL